MKPKSGPLTWLIKLTPLVVLLNCTNTPTEVVAQMSQGVAADDGGSPPSTDAELAVISQHVEQAHDACGGARGGLDRPLAVGDRRVVVFGADLTRPATHRAVYAVFVANGATESLGEDGLGQRAGATTQSIIDEVRRQRARWQEWLRVGPTLTATEAVGRQP